MEKNNLIKELIIFFVTENYKKYIEDNDLKSIQENQLPSIIDKLYIEKKSKLKEFLKSSLKQIQKDEYIGDYALNNICFEIFSDDELCKNRLINEIKYHQKS